MLLFVRIGPAGFQLLIIQADSSQAGIYTCLAYSKAGEVKEQFRLIVLGIEIRFVFVLNERSLHFFCLVPPRIQRENSSFLVIAPKPIELPCHVTQGHPIPTVK